VRQDAAICVILAVQCVEVFFNVYFRVLVSDPEFSHASEKILADLNDRKCGLDKKIKNWPRLVFGKKLPLGNGVGQRFMTLKEKRHDLMHFKSSHETHAFDGLEFHGLADTSVYDALTVESAFDALHVAEGFLCEVFRLQGFSSERLPHELHSWTGKPPL
jgi:hypothetical protein